MPTVELNCLFHGDTPDVANIFSVEVDTETTVSRLKEIIKEKKQNIAYFNNAKFKLWNVNESNEKLNILFDNPNANIKRKLGGKILEGLDKLSIYFSYKLNKNYMHILCELSELAPKDKIIFKEHSFELESAPGDSGSLVIDEDNLLVGILHGGFYNKSDAYIIPITLIKEHDKKYFKIEFESIGNSNND
ncbi:16390_t:CDS:2 [Racocetra fulgida]|uniref:16390_t:CDS:1 n=1 Tax=Racocetra fulgida TaxID=60492 RepID=A0A9N9AD92_9GLOM|nr:16390_t:CDS:2 [Racocetra fulgida]